MRSARRLLAVTMLGVLTMSGCKHGDSCTKDATDVNLQFDTITETADQLGVMTQLGTAPAQTMTVAHDHGQVAQTLHLALASYVPTTLLTVTITALANGVQLGAGQEATPLQPDCTIFTMEVEAPMDLTVLPTPDLSDLASSDLADD